MTAIVDELYVAHGVRFRYPGDWNVSEHQSDESLTITVASGETSFWLVSLYAACPDPEFVLQTAVDALRDEYEELDEYPVLRELCRQDAAGRDIEFVCLELLNSAFLRTIRTERFTLLVYYQGHDRELDGTRETLEAITGSLECEGHEPPCD